MKKAATLCLSLLLGGTALIATPVKSMQGDASIQAFWQKFKAAVIRGDKEEVANLSRFPLEMSYGIASIPNRAQLRRRYRQVFNQQTDAARCFAKAKTEINAQDPKQFTVACPDAAGNEVVIYNFVQTRSGWRFAGLDNLNE